MQEVLHRASRLFSPTPPRKLRLSTFAPRMGVNGNNRCGIQVWRLVLKGESWKSCSRSEPSR